MAEKVQYVIELNDKLSPGLKKATASALGLDKAMGGVGNKSKKVSSGLGSIGAGLKNLAGPLALAAAGMKAFAVASESVAEARQFESLTNAINFASGSAEEGAKNMQFLRSRAKLLGTDLKASTEGFKTLAASMIGSNLQGEGTRHIFEGVQVAAAAMGLSSEDAKGTFLALGQIMGKGKVQAEELRGQIGERIPGAFNIAAKAMGVSTAQLNKMMEQGQLVAEDFLPRFASELKNTFGAALPKSVNSSQAQLNRFNNNLLELKLKVGRLLLPALNRGMTAFTKFSNELIAQKDVILSEVISPIIQGYKTLGNEFLRVFNLIKGIFESVKGEMSSLVFVSKVLGKVLTFSIGLVRFQIKLVGTLFRALVTAWTNIFEFFSSPIDNAKKLLVKFSDFFGNIFKGIGDVFVGWQTLDLSKMKEGLKTIKNEGIKVGKEIAEKAGTFAFSAPTIPGLPGGKKDDSTALSEALKSPEMGAFVPGAADAKGGKAGKKSSTSVDGVKSGRPTNINIDIGKLIETMNITATDISDMSAKMKDEVAKALFSAVNNVNNIAR